MKVTRRLVLRGFAGAAVALPLLDINESAAQALPGTPPKRFLLFFEHGGTISASKKDGSRYDGSGAQNGVDAWDPADRASQTLQLGPIHQPLLPFVSSLLLPRGIDNRAARVQGPYGGDHDWANETVLTCANVRALDGGGHSVDNASIDRVIADRLAIRTPVSFPLLNLLVPAHNYGSPFFSAPNQRVSGEYNPTRAFNRLFPAGSFDAGVPTDGGVATTPPAERARQLKKSVLDGTSAGLSQYKGRLSASDQQVIDAHLTHLRELELRVTAVTPPPVTAAGCVRPDITSAGTNANTGYHNVVISKTGPVMADLAVAAFRCGLTNVVTIEVGDFHATWLNPTFPAAFNIGHSLHHDAREVGRAGPQAASWQPWYDTMLANRQWRMQLLARVFAGLKATPDGPGLTLLDTTLAMCASEFSTGADHSVADVPLLLAGAKGVLNTGTAGRYVNFNTQAASNPTTRAYSTTASLHNLYTTVLNAFGYPDTRFGNDNVSSARGHGPLAGLLI